jgi:hypothetical protein
MRPKELADRYRRRYKDTGEVDFEKLLNSFEMILTLSAYVVDSYGTSEEYASVASLDKALSKLGVFDD